jgi:hypothetical protein
MRLIYQKTPDMNELNIMRKAGYTHFVDPNTGHPSYVLRTSRDYYPRFHVYVEETEQTLEIDLHLDQKKPQYKGARAHNGEYDGPVVEREIARIAGWVKHLHNALPMRSGALEATLQPKEGIGEQNQPKQDYNPPQKDYTQPTPAPEESKKLFGGIF